MWNCLKNRSFLVALLATCFLLPAHNSLAYHFPWDQGHDTTDYPDPNDPGPCEGPNCDPCKGTGSPVYIATGHFIWSETDLTMAGRPGLSLTRTYNSNDPRAGIFGNGWSSDCDLHLTRTSVIEADATGESIKTEQLVLTAANGKRYIFPKNDNGGFDAPLGRSDSISESTDADGNAVVVLTSLGGYAHTFNDKSQLISRTEPNGSSINYGYNDQGQLSLLSDNADRSIALVYDSQGLVSSVTDHTGRVWSYVYDSDGNLVQVIDPLGGITAYEYQAYTPTGDAQTYYQLTNITDPTGVAISAISYQDDKVTSYTAGQNTFSYSYNESTRRVTKTDSLGARWIFDYSEDQVVTQKTDPVGNVREYDYDADGNLVSYTDALGKVWSSTFDDQRRVLSHTSPLGHTSSYEYDSQFKWPERAISALGRLTSTVYNEQGNAIQVTNAANQVVKMGYNGNGDLVQLDDALGNRTNMTYNAYGLVATTTDALGRSTQFGYDTLGRVTQLTSGGGEVMTITYDDLDRVTSVIDPSGNTTAYGYDAAGRTLTHTDPASKVTQYEYDTNGRLSKRIYPDLREITYQYRADNLTSTITRPDNSQVTYSYNPAKLVTSVNVGGAVTSYTYTARYELASTSNESATITFSYDDDGRLVNENFDGTTLVYTYNADNERTGFSYNGRQLDYTRDSLGRVTEISTPEGMYGFSYDANGKRTATTLPNGSQVAYGYDAAEQLTDLTHSGTYNASYGYQYNDSGVLTQVSGAEDWQYVYDDDTQLLSATSDIGNFNYSYDAAGNITSDQRVYDDNHRLLQTSEWTLSYDQRGNVTEKLHTNGTKVQYVWNGRSQLVRVDRFLPGSTVADSVTSYTYGPMGRRLSKVVDGTETQYIYDGVDRVATLDSSGVVIGNYTFGPSIDEPLGVAFSNGLENFYHADHMGSIVALTDDSQVVDQYRYGPWGQNFSSNTSSENDIRYAGREYDTEDLYYSRARYYDPTLQRFLSEDPLGFDGGDHNLYRYVGNNPINFTDPTGNWAFLIPVVWAGIEIGLAVYDTYELINTLTDPCSGTMDKVVESGLFLAGFIAPGGGYTKADDAVKYADNVADTLRRSPCGCFDADTEVLTDKGYKSIEEIEVGELIFSKSELSGEVDLKPVTDLLRYDNRAFYELILVGPQGTFVTLDVTDDHLFWVIDRGWALSGSLEIGTKLIALDEKIYQVVSMLPTGVVGESYNLEVSDFHTYFVGTENIWVHNCPFSLDSLSAAGRAAAKGGRTDAGRAYQKHMDRGELPSVAGKNLDQTGQDLLDNILTDPGSTIFNVNSGNAAGGVRFVSPDGIGVTFRADGSLAYFGIY